MPVSHSAKSKIYAMNVYAYMQFLNTLEIKSVN